MSNPIRQTLSTLPFFKELTQAQLDQVSKLFVAQPFREGAAVFRENDPGTAFYIVVSGMLSVKRQHPDGGVKTICALTSGDFFGEIALLANTPRTASVVTQSKTDLLVLSKADFHRLMEEYPAFGRYFNSLLSKRIEATNRSLMETLGSEADQFHLTDLTHLNGFLAKLAGRLDPAHLMDRVAEAHYGHARDLMIEKTPLELFTGASKMGEYRLERTWIEMSLSGLIAGINVAFGALAASAAAAAAVPFTGEETARLVGAIFFPIGFVFLAMGKAELFTENFLIPVAAVLERKAAPALLLKLWSLTLSFNMVGAFLFAFLVSRGHEAILSAGTGHHIEMVALGKVSHGMEATVLAAVFAGILITLMTWLMLSGDNWISKIAVIWAVGFLINLNGFNHIVVNSFEIFYGMFNGLPITVENWFTRYALPTVLGNFIGGTLFVTMLVYLQAKTAQWRRRKGEV